MHGVLYVIEETVFHNVKANALVFEVELIHEGLMVKTYNMIFEVKNKMKEHEKVFVAFSRKLLRSLQKVKMYLDSGLVDEAKELVDELIEDTEGDCGLPATGR